MPIKVKASEVLGSFPRPPHRHRGRLSKNARKAHEKRCVLYQEMWRKVRSCLDTGVGLLYKGLYISHQPKEHVVLDGFRWVRPARRRPHLEVLDRAVVR